MSATAEVLVKCGSAWMILAPPPAPGPRFGSFLAATNHWNPTGCASAGLAPLIKMRSAFLISRQWLVIAPLSNVAAKLTTVGPCQTLACCSRCTKPRPRITFAAKYPSSLLKAAPPAKSIPSVRLTVFPVASCATKLASRASLTRWASLLSMSSQVICCQGSEPGARYSGVSTRRALLASCIAVAPLGQSRPSFTGLSGFPSICRSLRDPSPLVPVNATREQPTAQYGQTECDSVAPSTWKLCLICAAWAMSNPRAVRPAAPVPAAPIFRKSRRVTCGTRFLQRVNGATRRPRQSTRQFGSLSTKSWFHPSPACGGGQGGGVIRWASSEHVV